MMLEVDWSAFLSSFDFDALMAAFSDGSWKWMLEDKVIWTVMGILFIMIAFKNTRSLATFAITWGSIGIVYAVGGVVLKNSVISEPGPFIILALLFFGFVGYIVWTRLISSS